MNIFTYLWGRVKSMFVTAEVGKAFGVELIQSSDMDNALKQWNDISIGRPPWLNSEDGIETINMAKHIADTRTKLIVLDLGIAVSGENERAQYLQDVCDSLLDRLPEHVSDALRVGGMMLKWNGVSWDFILPGDFGITKVDSNGHIIGAIFAEHITHGWEHYTRLEYHRFDDELYVISNKAFRNRSSGNGQYTLGYEIPLTMVEEWAHMQPDTYIQNLEKPLFSYFRLPGANNIDATSPLGISVFSNAITELKAIDIAVSRKNTEVEDSKHMTFVGQQLIKYADTHGIKLPRIVKGFGLGRDDAESSAIKEHVPTMLTDNRIKDINFDLSMAGVKCGFSEGVFVLDGQTGMITATQVEADDRDTIQTIKNDRDALQTAIEQAIYGADAMITLLGLAPLGTYEVSFSFGDITYNYSEDKQQWYSDATQGRIPFWYYLVKFEKMTEQEAKELCGEADSEKQNEKSLFPSAE